MQISLLQISLLRFFKQIHKFALSEFMPYALGYFISLVQFFWLFLPNLANANFYRNKGRIRQDPSVFGHKASTQLPITNFRV